MTNNTIRILEESSTFKQSEVQLTDYNVLVRDIPIGETVFIEDTEGFCTCYAIRHKSKLTYDIVALWGTNIEGVNVLTNKEGYGEGLTGARVQTRNTYLYSYWLTEQENLAENLRNNRKPKTDLENRYIYFLMDNKANRVTSPFTEEEKKYFTEQFKKDFKLIQYENMNLADLLTYAFFVEEHQYADEHRRNWSLETVKLVHRTGGY